MENSNTNRIRKTEDSWKASEPLQEYLKFGHGFNYYLIRSKFEHYELEGKSGPFERLICEATHLLVIDSTGRKTLESPIESIDSELSIPISAARTLRKECEKIGISGYESLVGQVLVIQRTGTDMDTRYPSMNIMSIEEYDELKPKPVKK